MQSPPVTSTGQIDHTREASNKDNVQFNENCNVLTHTHKLGQCRIDWRVIDVVIVISGWLMGRCFEKLMNY